MAYRSIETLQSELSKSVFAYSKDARKAAGRALGTLVELITYYLLDSWNLTPYIAIETPLGEFSNPQISHNVEFTLHPLLTYAEKDFHSADFPLTASSIQRIIGTLENDVKKCNNSLLSKDFIVKNSCKIGENQFSLWMASLLSSDVQKRSGKLSCSNLLREPFAMFECKRVGIEEGMKKGPQTIEKAKQGAYVARTVSALQRFRCRDGKIAGLYESESGELLKGDYYELLNKFISEPLYEKYLRNFVLSVGIISNHGNWFTNENRNKELEVLAQSYDWLLFLTDDGLSEFIENCLFSEKLPNTQKAFMGSYPKKDHYRFTKASLNLDAHLELKEYFSHHQTEIRKWFNLISPEKGNIENLISQLQTLCQKKWKEIYS